MIVAVASFVICGLFLLMAIPVETVAGEEKAGMHRSGLAVPEGDTPAEHHDQTQIATLNHRDFTVVRPNHTDAFELLPEPAPS